LDTRQEKKAYISNSNAGQGHIIKVWRKKELWRKSRVYTRCRYQMHNNNQDIYFKLNARTIILGENILSLHKHNNGCDTTEEERGTTLPKIL
jgi:hypothetical protein